MSITAYSFLKIISGVRTIGRSTLNDFHSVSNENKYYMALDDFAYITNVSFILRSRRDDVLAKRIGYLLITKAFNQLVSGVCLQ